MKTVHTLLFAPLLLALFTSGCTHSSEALAGAEAERVQQTARKAYDAFAQGWATGDFEPYLALLTDEFEFSYPFGADRGVYTGPEGHAHMVDKVRGHSSRGERLTLKPPTRIAVGGNTVFFEFDSEGQFGAYHYRGHNIIAFDVTGERISAFREFFGDIDPSFFCAPPR